MCRGTSTSPRLCGAGVGRLELQLQHEDRPQDLEVVELDPGGGMGSEEGALLLREELADLALAQHGVPHAAGSASGRLSDAEQTKPPGITSTSTIMFGDAACARRARSVTTGRSFTTESSPFFCTRRARATTPCLYSARSGVSKKNT